MSKDIKIDVDFIEDKIFKILLKEHKEEAKHKIIRLPNHSNPERLNFACPICGDSAKSVYKKRGNLYMNTMMYHCYDNGCRMSFVEMCDTFDQKLDIDTRVKLYDYIDENMKFSANSNDFAMSSLDKLIPIKEWIEKMNSDKNSWLVDIKTIQVDSKAYNYLKFERNIVNYDNILQGTYRVIKENKVVYTTDVIISLNRGDEYLLGMQLRNLVKDKNKRFYKIIQFEELYNSFNIDPIDPLEAMSYNKLSHFYNILNVNYDRPITIFEGYLDSIFYPNSIGLVGANNDKDILKFLTDADDSIELKFFYDNDKKGIHNAREMVKLGYPVFLWKKLFDKLLEKSKNQSTFKKTLDGIVDLNDLVIASKNRNVYEAMKLNKFFSKDVFDSRYLINEQTIIKEDVHKEMDFGNITFDSLRHQ